nr:MAG TPA: protein of unknown function DUF765 [Caudoviricetes sp.]
MEAASPAPLDLLPPVCRHEKNPGRLTGVLIYLRPNTLLLGAG